MPLTLHKGALPATREQIDAVPVPMSTDTYCPIPYGELIHQFEDILPRWGMTKEREEWALMPDGSKMFGVMSYNHPGSQTIGLSLGLRSSYDKSISPTGLAGFRVWICDNLAFSGEVSVSRKNTIHSMKDLPLLIFEATTKIEAAFTRNLADVKKMDETPIPAMHVDHILVEAVKRRALMARDILQIRRLYWEDEASLVHCQSQNVWRLFNAYTEHQKKRNIHQQMLESPRFVKLVNDYMAN